MSIFPQSGAKGLERLMRLKYYNVQKRQITFSLVLNVVENTDYLKKTSNKSCLKKFVNLWKLIPKFSEIRLKKINISPSLLINTISSKIHLFSKN